jgi:hypothetical protein
MAGSDGQGRFCHLTSQNGLGNDSESSTATACAGLQNQWAALRVAGGFDSRPPPPPSQTARRTNRPDLPGMPGPDSVSPRGYLLGRAT